MFVTDISVLVVAKKGCENVQLKIKTVKSICNRYLYFQLFKLLQNSFSQYQILQDSPCFLVC